MPLRVDIISELSSIILEKQAQYASAVKSESMSKEEARKKYDALIRAREIVNQYYKRIEEDIKLTDELNKPEILNDMINKNPSVVNLINTFKLKSE